MAFKNEITAGTTLIREAIQSQGFQSGVQGWTIRADGSAEFNNVVIRGGTVVSGLALYYDGTPALGNLIMSISATAGTDAFGNAYVEGVGLYGASGELVAIDAAGNTATVSGSLPVTGLLAALPGLALQPVFNAGGDPGSIGALDPGTHTDFSLLLASPSPVLGGLPGTDFSQINMVGHYSGPCSVDIAAELTTATGNLDVVGNTTAANLQSGQFNASFALAPSALIGVSFPIPYPVGVTPRVMTNIDSGAGNTIRWGSRAINITNAGFQMFLFKGDAADPSQVWANIPVQWWSHYA